jgi:hypothetical protein
MIPPQISGLITVPGVASGGVPGQPVSGVAGNPGVATRSAKPPVGWNYQENQGYAVGPNMGPYPANYGEPGGYGAGQGPDREPKQPGNNYGGDKPEGHVWSPGVMNPPHTAWRGGADFANENTVYDRHVLVKTGNPRTGVETSVTGTPPNPDDPSTPPSPVFAFLNRAMNPQVGSDNNANQDDLTRPYARNAQGMYVGEAGTAVTPVYGGVPGMWQPYGSYAGYTARDVKGIQSPVEQGQPGDGPRKIESGPPHGLHSQTYPSYDSTLGRYMAIPQMHSPRVDRPANSKVAGQDYSQTVQPQGETGTVVQTPTRFTSQSRFG